MSEVLFLQGRYFKKYLFMLMNYSFKLEISANFILKGYYNQQINQNLVQNYFLSTNLYKLHKNPDLITQSTFQISVN